MLLDKMMFSCNKCSQKHFFSKRYINQIRDNIKALGFDYDENICPCCNGGIVVKKMIDKHEPINRFVLNKLPKDLSFDEEDRGYADKLNAVLADIKSQIRSE